MVPNDEPKSVNIDKISTALHVYYLNLIVNYLNTVQIAQIQAYNFECTPCSDVINGPMNRVFDIKSGHDFCWYRNSIQVIYFQINGFNSLISNISYRRQSNLFWHFFKIEKQCSILAGFSSVTISHMFAKN